MARRRRQQAALSAEAVAAILEEEHPLPVFDPDAGDWQEHVKQCRRVRAQRRAILAEHGLTTLDVLAARYPHIMGRSGVEFSVSGRSSARHPGRSSAHCSSDAVPVEPTPGARAESSQSPNNRSVSR